ncbi:MAG: hypothetical protein ABIP35_07595 [Ginsengibacter sp.]
MKQTLLILSIIFFYLNSNAQLTANNWLVGGSGSFYSYSEDFSTISYNQIANYTSIDIAASVGYFFFDKFAAGLRPGFSSYKGKVVRASVGSGTYMNNYKFDIGPFARYYFLNSEKQYNILADISYQIGINKNFGGLNDKGKYNTFSLMGGTEIFFNQTAGIEILLGYTQKIVSIENSSNALSNNKKGFLASIGFTLHLEKN